MYTDLFQELMKLLRSGCLLVLADVHMPESALFIMQCHMEHLAIIVPRARNTCKRYLLQFHGRLDPPTGSCVPIHQGQQRVNQRFNSNYINGRKSQSSFLWQRVYAVWQSNNSNDTNCQQTVNTCQLICTHFKNNLIAKVVPVCGKQV